MTDPIRVLGLDISTSSTGIAMPDWTTKTIRPRAGTENFGMRRLHEIIDRLQPYITLADADVAVLEDYSLHGPGGPLVLVKLAEVGGHVRLRLYEHGTPFVPVNPKTLKVYATGDGKASKEQMVAAATADGGRPANHDEADAYWCRSLGIDWHLGISERDAAAGDPLAMKRLAIIRALPWPNLADRSCA